MDLERSGVPDLIPAFSRLQSLLTTTGSIDEFLDNIAHLVTSELPPVVACGITLDRDGSPVTAASSGELAERIDQIQYDEDEGPCLQSVATGQVVVVDDLRIETRWPRYTARVAGTGILASISLPLRTEDQVTGALNLYMEPPQAVTVAIRRTMELFAAQASGALALMQAFVHRGQVSQQLEQALSSRSVIDQAIGILMGQQRCSAEEAFALLRANSQNNNRKLRDVAADLVQRVSGAAATPASNAHSRTA